MTDLPSDNSKAEEVRQLTTAQIWANILFVSALLGAVVLIDGWPRWKYWLLFVIVTVFLLFSSFNWRGPYCNAALGRPGFVAPDSCSRCGHCLSDPIRLS